MDELKLAADNVAKAMLNNNVSLIEAESIFNLIVTSYIQEGKTSENKTLRN